MEEVLYKATIKFDNLNDAETFVKHYSRHTRKGHTVHPDGTVNVYGMDEPQFEWVKNYVDGMNKKENNETWNS